MCLLLRGEGGNPDLQAPMQEKWFFSPLHIINWLGCPEQQQMHHIHLSQQQILFLLSLVPVFVYCENGTFQDTNFLCIVLISHNFNMLVQQSAAHLQTDLVMKSACLICSSWESSCMPLQFCTLQLLQPQMTEVRSLEEVQLLPNTDLLGNSQLF